uniref:Uncharacterized protein n=1 Tax=Manihot esculenta TaxID=3983 RepID=A0A2C9U6T3_MANES
MIVECDNIGVMEAITDCIILHRMLCFFTQCCFFPFTSGSES